MGIRSAWPIFFDFWLKIHEKEKSQLLLVLTLRPMTPMQLGFNRWMQHTRNCISRRSVADEAKTKDLLHGKSEGADVGALARRRQP
ncbi:MAG: hypothetical protein Q8L39_13555, partial [Burkholderiales bacterium]|nr:hypothetical protein [Burkholderiales bacterium]